MRAWIFRILRAGLLGLAAWLAFVGLDRNGMGAWFMPLTCGVFVVWLGSQAVRRLRARKREATWDRWEAAIGDDDKRTEAVNEVRQALARSRRFGVRLAQEQAHLSVILAELLDAADRPDEACRVLSQVDTSVLTASQAVVVRHARVVAFLSAGQIADAETILEARTPSGEADMDGRLDLLQAMVLIERAHPEQAKELATQVAGRFAHDESMTLEASVVVACACEALGDSNAAVERFRELDVITLTELEKLGPRRARPLAAAALALKASTASSGEADGRKP